MISTSIIRTRWAAVGAAVAITLGAVGIGGLNIASADISSGDRPVFVPINPCRLLDTRAGAANVGPKASPLGAGETYTVTAHGDNGECTGASTIPTDALSLSLNVTAVGATASTFLTFWGDGANPGTSNLNPRPGAAPTPNSVNTPLSSSGTFNVYNDAGDVNIIADVNGYYAHHDHDDRYVQQPSNVLVTPSDFQEFNEDPNNWEFEGLLYHGSSASAECAVASFEVPVGMQVSGAELVYEAIDPIDEVTVDVRGFIGVAGTHLNEDVVLEIASFDGPLPATPGSAGVADSRLVEGQALELESDAGAVDPARYVHHAEVCTDGDLIVYSIDVSLEPA